MYEDKTYESLLQEKLAGVSSALDKREGSIIYDALAPNSIESAMIYVALDSILSETFADTASREYLIRRCAERGIIPYAATAAIGIGVFNMNVPIGSRFSCDKFNWIVTEKIENGKYYMTCETAGAEPNSYTGLLIPIDYIDGLTSATLTSIAILGEDEEETEALRERYLNSFMSESYGFNRAQYIDVVQAMPGVGGVKPYRATKVVNGAKVANAPGHVTLVITDSDGGVPTGTLIDTVQTAIDPTQNSGDGLGLAPIDHEVSVMGVTGTPINISTTLTYAGGWDLNECLPYINAAIDAHLAGLNAGWADNENLIVRIAYIESRLLAVTGIIDVTGTAINGSTSNLTLGSDSIAVRGMFTANET